MVGRRGALLAFLLAGCPPHGVPPSKTMVDNSVSGVPSDGRRLSCANARCPASMTCSDDHCYLPCSASSTSCPKGEQCARVDVGCECDAHVLSPSTFRCLRPLEQEQWSAFVPVYRFVDRKWRLVRRYATPIVSPPKDAWSDDCSRCPSGSECFSAPEGARPRCLRPCSWDGNCAPGEYCECNTAKGRISGKFACVQDDPQGSGLRKNMDRLSELRSPNEPGWCSLQ